MLLKLYVTCARITGLGCVYCCGSVSCNEAVIDASLETDCRSRPRTKYIDGDETSHILT